MIPITLSYTLRRLESFILMPSKGYAGTQYCRLYNTGRPKMKNHTPIIKKMKILKNAVSQSFSSIN